MNILPYLKPCPFCGCAEVNYARGQGDYASEFEGWVSCANCDAEGPAVGGRDPKPEDIAAAWNQRPEIS